jgi:hypothetical protein
LNVQKNVTRNMESWRSLDNSPGQFARVPYQFGGGEAWRKALLVCGIASSLLYAVMIWAIRYEGYKSVSQFPSELTAIGLRRNGYGRCWRRSTPCWPPPLGGASGVPPGEIVRCQSWAA